MRSVRAAVIVTLALLGTTLLLGIVALAAIRQDLALKRLERRKQQALTVDRVALELHRGVERGLRSLGAIAPELTPENAVRQLARELDQTRLIWQAVRLDSDGDLLWPTLRWEGPDDERLHQLARTADCTAYRRSAPTLNAGHVAALAAGLTMTRRDRGCDVWPVVRTALYVDAHLVQPSARDWNFFTHRGSGTWVLTTARATLILKPFGGGWIGFSLATGRDIAPLVARLPKGAVAFVARQPSLASPETDRHVVRFPSPLQGYALYVRFPASAVAWPWPLLGIVALSFGFAGWASWFIVRGARQRERQLKRQQDLFSSITHELKSPVAAQMALSQTLLAHELDAEQRADYHRRLLSETQRLSRLIDKVLTLNRAQYADIPREACNLTLICHELLETFEDQAAERGHRLIFDDRQPAWVEVDGQGIRLAIANLLDNALKYTRSPGEVRLQLLRDERRVTLRVWDSGPGFPPELRERVFAPFARGDDRREPGSGLGLFLAKRIATANGGELRLLPEQSETSGGVELSLPLRPGGPPQP